MNSPSSITRKRSSMEAIRFQLFDLKMYINDRRLEGRRDGQGKRLNEETPSRDFQFPRKKERFSAGAHSLPTEGEIFETDHILFPVSSRLQGTTPCGPRGTHRGMVASAKSTQHKNHRPTQEERTYYTRLSCDGFS